MISAAGLDEKVLTLTVRASSKHIAEFKAAVFDTGSSVPIAFAFCWITLAEVRARIASLIGPGQLPLHESQSFEVIEPLAPETDYVLTLSFALIETPPGLDIQGRVSRQDGVIILHMQTLLRLLPVREAPE